MKFTYRLIQDGVAFVAECVESDAQGEGKSPREAIASLHTALEERMFRPDAVAPPEIAPTSSIELTLAAPDAPDAATNDPSGPGG